MRSLFKFCYNQAYAVLGLFLLLTALAIWKTTQLEVSVSSDKLIPKDSPLRAEYEAVKKKFGSDQIALIYAEDDALFEYERLKKLKALSVELNKLAQVQRTESLFNVNNISGSAGWVDTSPLLRSIPKSPKKLAKKQQQAIDNPLMLRNIISPDGNATLLTLYLDKPDDADPLFDRELYNAVETLLQNYRDDFGQLYQVGSPALHVWMAEYVLNDQKLLLPIAGFVLVLLIGFMMRSVQGCLIPILNAFISSAWTLGFMSLMGIPFNMLNSIVPALILIIGATEDVHILTEFKEAKAQGKNNFDSIQYIAHHIGLTLFLTGLTTVLGFAATGLNAITIMQEFGWTAAFGMLARFIVSVSFLPAYLRFFGNFIGKKSEISSTQQAKPIRSPLGDRVCQFLMDNFVERPYSAIILFSLIALPCLFIINKISVSNDLIGFLKEDSPVVKKLDNVAEKLSGSKVINITLKGDPGDFKLAKKLKQLESVTQWLRQDLRTDTVISLADHLSLVNQTMFGGDIKDRRIPDKDALVAQYLIFFHRSDLKPYVTGDYSTANIAIRCNINDSNQLNQFVQEVKDTLNSGAFGLLSYSVTGKSVMVAASVEKIITGQIISLSSMIGLLFIIVAILFLSARAAFLAVLSNLFPVVVVFGIMGFMGISLNVGTCMVAAITIGIAVDDTLHLMVRYNKDLKALKNEHKAIHSSVRAELFPVITTSLGLAGGFIVLSFSSFVPVLQFGLLSAVVIFLALLADLILTPVLFSTIRLITLWDVMGFHLRQALLEKSPMFADMTKWQAKKLILLGNLQEYDTNTTVIHEGDMGDSMYVVVDGEMEVSKQVNGQKVVFTQLGVGQVFGEVALVSRIKRTADVIATQPTKTLVLDWESLGKLQRSSPYLSSKLFLNLSKILGMRLKDANQKIESKTTAPFPPRRDTQTR